MLPNTMVVPYVSLEGKPGTAIVDVSDPAKPKLINATVEEGTLLELLYWEEICWRMYAVHMEVEYHHDERLVTVG